MLTVAALTGFIGRYGTRITRGTSDFIEASRGVGPRWNAAAIAGEYLSAASFLGIAGLILKDGFDSLWYPVGFTVGYVALLLFVAAPLRRSGAYTLPDFAEARLGSGPLRRICTMFVVIICWLYLVPQLQGAGLTVGTVTGLPAWAGAGVVVVLITFNIFTKWVHSITLVQAFQYWIKLTALAVPVFVVLLYMTGEKTEFRDSLSASAAPFFSEATTVAIETDVLLQVDEPMLLEAAGKVDNMPVQGSVYWAPGEHRVAEDTELNFSAGSRVPVISGAPVENDAWLTPLSSGDDAIFVTYSLMVALFLGTMGLPHVLGRYYTNPDGRAARKTTLVVLGLLGIFYIFPVLSGVLSRLYVPKLLVTGNTDAAVLELPRWVLTGWPANLLAGVVAAGAFAAFMSASSGLVGSINGVLSTDMLPGRLRNVSATTLVAWSMPLAFALAVSSLDLAQSVGLAFAVAASSFCPLLVLGIWWRGLTDIGASAGMVVGGGLTVLAVLPAAMGVLSPGWQAVFAQPALFTVPVAFLTMVVVSQATKDRVPADVSRIMLRMHAPERLGFGRDRNPSGYKPSPSPPLRTRGGRHRR